MLNTVNSSVNSSKYQAVSCSRKLLIIGLHQPRRKDVSFAPARMNQRLGEPCVDLGSQSPDIYIDDVGERVEVLVPYVLRDLFTIHDAVLIEHQELEQSILFGSDTDGLAGPADHVIRRVQREIRNLDRFRTDLSNTPGQSAEPRQEFLEIERLGEVVIRATVEARNAIVYGVTRGEHENGDAEAGAAQLTANGIAILDGQHDIEDHQIVLVHRRVIESLLAIPRDIDRVSLLAQALGNEPRYS